jgi:hypothetical protein
VKTTEDNEQLMTRYLLGELSEPERDRIEERYFHDRDFYLQLRAMEEELICDYVRGDLPPPERARFEQYFLASPRQRQKYERTKEWLGFIAAASLPLNSEPLEPPAAPQRAWLTSWRFPALAFRAAFVAALLALIVGGLWLGMQVRRLQAQLAESENNRAALEQQAQEWQQQIAQQRARGEQLAGEVERQRDALAQLKSSSAPTPGAESKVFAFPLTAGLTRDLSEAPKFLLPADAEWVRLHLYFEAHTYPSYRAVLQTASGEELWTGSQLKARSSRSGGEVVWSVPARLFSKRDYVILLSSVTAAGELEDVAQYSFRVDKR